MLFGFGCGCFCGGESDLSPQVLLIYGGRKKINEQGVMSADGQTETDIGGGFACLLACFYLSTPRPLPLPLLRFWESSSSSSSSSSSPSSSSSSSAAAVTLTEVGLSFEASNQACVKRLRGGQCGAISSFCDVEE
jgi:hypothetical protein